MISQGSANVLIGGPTGTYLGIQSKVPSWVRWAVVVATIAVSLGSAAREIGPMLAEINETGLARALQTGAKALKTSLEEKGGGASQPTNLFLPKKIGVLEPGAVPSTPELEAARDAAKLRTGQSAPGYPDLPDDAAQTFGEGVRPWDGSTQSAPISRVIDVDSNPAGSYWQGTPPETEGAWRGQSAVKNEWNGDGAYVEADPAPLNADGTPTPMKGWIGPAAPQDSSTPGYMLPGNGEQIWLPKGTAAPGNPIPTPWNNGQ